MYPHGGRAARRRPYDSSQPIVRETDCADERHFLGGWLAFRGPRRPTVLLLASVLLSER